MFVIGFLDKSVNFEPRKNWITQQECREKKLKGKIVNFYGTFDNLFENSGHPRSENQKINFVNKFINRVLIFSSGLKYF